MGVRTMTIFFLLVIFGGMNFGQSPANPPTAAQNPGSEKDFATVRDYGAKCDGGKTDDRVAIQAAIDRVGIGTLYFPSPGCGVSYPGLVLYPENAGMSLRGLAQTSAGYYAPGASGGLVAYSASAPAPVSLSHCSASSTLVTCTTSAQHSFKSGMRITVSGVTPASYNLPDGLIQVTGPTSFSYYVLAAPEAYVSGGEAKTSWSLLTIYAISTLLDHLHFDGNSSSGAIGTGVATHGLVDAMGTNMEWNAVTTKQFYGDGAQVFDEYTPATTLSASARAGENALSVSSVTNNRLTFGAHYCMWIALDYGQPTQEEIPLGRVSGNTLNLASKLVHDHSQSTSTVQCHGNADNLRSTHYSSYANGGWGFAVVPGLDNNGFFWYDHNSNVNKLGGELWFGNVHLHYGGDYNGDGGPPVQLGDAHHAVGTAFSVFFPIGGDEQGSGVPRAVVAACDGSSIVYFKAANEFRINTGSTACPGYSAHGSTTIGIGPNGAQAQLEVVNSQGAMQFQPAAAGPSGSITNGLSFWDQNLTSMSAQLIPSVMPGNGLSSRKDINGGGILCKNAQLEASGFTNPAQMLMLGVDTAANATCIQGALYGGSTYPLTLNPAGGPVGTGDGGFTSPGKTSLYSAPNLITAETGSDDALIASLQDGFGKPVPVAAGLRVTLVLSTYSLRAGANTLNLNGSGAIPIVSAFNPANSVGTAIPRGGAVDLLYQGGHWLLMGQ